MVAEAFENGLIEVTDFFDSTTDEWVVEFRDPKCWDGKWFLAVALREGREWSDAVVGIDPQVGDIPVRLMLWPSASPNRDCFVAESRNLMIE
ncbi:hypothetical protein AB0K60_03195 [Thermopolyspora sp. NPDC052614]|uniref:hypothetical protein n=1 Tax=Thermopolyspora sp. NPDC052614 TaxID=3155682 RepID=UPI003429A990